MRLRWSRSYLGVSHLEGLKAFWQITVEDHGSIASAYVLNLRGPNAFTPTHQTAAPTVREARAWAESQAVNLGIVQE